MTLLRLARALHKSLDEVSRWSYAEIETWLLFFELERREAENT